MTTLTFTIPKSLFLSANDRPHWAVKMRTVRELRRLGLIGGRDVEPQGTTHVAAFIGDRKSVV